MGGGKIKDATALPSDVAKGKVFYNNDGRQVGTKENNPWSDLKFIEISIPDYNYSEEKDLPNGNDYMTRANENDSYPIWEKVFNCKYTQKISLNGTVKFVERLETTKKYYVYSKEFGNKGGGLCFVNANGYNLFSVYHDGNYLYLCTYNQVYAGEKLKIWYR